jgi:F-type H+-transporting ATPase subunit delta
VPAGSPPVYDEAALQRVEADVAYLHAVINNAHVRRFLYEPGVRRSAKRAAIRDLLASSVHPVVSAFMVRLLWAGGEPALASGGREFSVDAHADACTYMAGRLGALEQVLKDMLKIEGLLARESVRAFICNESVMRQGRASALKQLLAGRVHPFLVLVVLFLFAFEELDKFAAISEAACAREAETGGVLAGEVVSSCEVPDYQMSALEQHASGFFGQPLKLTYRNDSALLGGIMIRAGSKVMDLTIDARMEDLRHLLMVAPSEDKGRILGFDR